MNTLKLELGVIGDFLTGSFSTHPLPPKGERGVGLRPEYFSDPSTRTAFEEIQKAGSSDPTILVPLVQTKCGIDFFVKAVTEASVISTMAVERVFKLQTAARKRVLTEKVMRVLQNQSQFTENFFIGELERVLNEAEREVSCANLAAESLEEFLAEPPAALDPIIAYAFERGDKVELIAPSKCRKSFFALDLAIHCAAGIPFRGLAIPKPRKVLLVNLEIKRDWMKRRVLSRLEGYGRTLKEIKNNLQLMNCRGQGGAVRESILARVKATHPDFVILDPRYKLMRPDEDENTGNGLVGILNLLDAIAEEGAAVMIVSHDKKGDVKSQDIRDRGAGSNWAGRDVDCRFVMTPDKNDDNLIEVGILARNYAPRPPLKLRVSAGRFETF